MNTQNEWLESERNKRRKSKAFSKAMILGQPLLGLLFLPAFFSDVTQPWPRLFWASYLAVAFFVLLLVVRKRFAPGSVGRYVTNYMATVSGISFPLVMVLAISSFV